MRIGSEKRLFQYGSDGKVKAKYGMVDHEKGWQNDIQGAIGEVATSGYLRIAYQGDELGVYGRPDVGPYQVRTTNSARGNLILHPSDRDEEIFILVRCHREVLRIYDLMGWEYGRVVKAGGPQGQYWKTHKADGTAMREPCFCYPAELLQDMRKLLKMGETEHGTDLSTDHAASDRRR